MLHPQVANTTDSLFSGFFLSILKRVCRRYSWSRAVRYLWAKKGKVNLAFLRQFFCTKTFFGKVKVHRERLILFFDSFLQLSAWRNKRCRVLEKYLLFVKNHIQLSAEKYTIIGHFRHNKSHPSILCFIDEWQNFWKVAAVKEHASSCIGTQVYRYTNKHYVFIQESYWEEKNLSLPCTFLIRLALCVCATVLGICCLRFCSAVQKVSPRPIDLTLKNNLPLCQVY